MIGDSNFAHWYGMEKDMGAHKVYNAGFAGSTTSAILDHTQELVIKFEPKTIVYCCGDNDVLFKIPSKEIARNFIKFVDLVRKSLPEV